MRRVLLAGSLILGAVATAASFAAAPTLLGKDAPDFVLKARDGRNLRMSEFRGQVVLVNFWARWAGDSRQEMPALDRINTTYNRAGLVVLNYIALHDANAISTFPGLYPAPNLNNTLGTGSALQPLIAFHPIVNGKIGG